MGSPLDQARHVRDQLKAWLLEHAYPLWARAGRDPDDGFYEKIGNPATCPAWTTTKGC